jgi:hypothetical protein
MPDEDAVRRAIARLGEADLIVLRDGAISAAYPFSSEAPGHTVRFTDGRPVNALCPTDAVGIYLMLGEEITIRSACPYCGHGVVIALKSGRVASREPEGVVEYVKLGDARGSAAALRSPQIALFCGRDHLACWVAENPRFGGGETYMLEEVLEDGEAIFADLFAPVTDTSAALDAGNAA